MSKDLSDKAPTRRFTSRVAHYRSHRPGYPAEVVDLLTERCGLTPDAVVADIGCGTGLLARCFLESGNKVLGVEPNAAMRAACLEELAGHAGFQAVEGAAEATTLPDASVDFIVAGQAFHWFEREKSKQEFRRILKPGGWVVLIWNERHVDSSPFMIGFEALLQRYAPDYVTTSHRRVDTAAVSAFFAPAAAHLEVFENAQTFDLEGITGRLMSSSYAPEEGHPNHAPMLVALADLFQKTAEQGRVTLRYDTKVWFGQLG